MPSHNPIQPSRAAPVPVLGTVRVAIDPELGEHEAQIRAMLAPMPFVVVANDADYVLTSKADLPLDLVLVDASYPPEFWTGEGPSGVAYGNGPTELDLGNIEEPSTRDNLLSTLTAAARVRALLDRTKADMRGVEACSLQPKKLDDEPANRDYECVPLDKLGVDRLVINNYLTQTIQVRNTATEPRYVSVLGSTDTLRLGFAGTEGSEPVQKLAPGAVATIPLSQLMYIYPLNRIYVVVSDSPFDTGAMSFPSPLGLDPGCDVGDASPACLPTLAGVPLNADTAARTFQLYSIDDLRPGMGNSADAVAAPFMAQFYSVIPYTKTERDADEAKEDNDPTKKFLNDLSAEERQHRCGGTLIAANLVLTAAHCVAKGQYAGDGLAKVMKDRRVRLGSLALGKGGPTYAIGGVAVHPGYNAITPHHDLALLLLKPDRGSTQRSGPISPIEFAKRPLPPGSKARAFGYGLTGSVTPNGNIMMTVDQRVQTSEDVLQVGEMISVSLADCKTKLKNEVAAGMVCMYSKRVLEGGSSADGVFTCRGDSGGPLVRSTNGRDVLVGAVSWSKGCGYKTYPSVFTDVGSYSEWIAAASKALKPGLAIRPADPARPTLGASRTAR